MANSKVSALPAATALSGAELFYGVQGGADVKVTASQLSGVVTPTVATPAGGSTGGRLVFGTTSGFGIYYGSGAPSVTAAKGSLYLRSDGSTVNDRMYVNTDGTTGWTAVATAG